MRKSKVLLGLVLVVLVSVGTATEMFDGTGTATGTLSRDSQNHARVGAAGTRIGKVSVTRVIVTDLFGRKREVRWDYVGGKGTARPTIKFKGEDRPKKDEHVTVEFTTTVDGDFGPLDLHLY